MRGTSESMKKWGIFMAIIVLVALVLPFFIYSLIPKQRVEKRYVLRDIDTIEDLLRFGDISTINENLLKNMVRELDYLKVSLPEKFHRMDFFLKVQPILSKANDQNTEIIFGVPSYYPVMPFKARFVDERLFVIESIDNKLKPGDEITSVNEKDIESFFKYLKSLVSADSEALLCKKMENRFWQLPFIERREKFTLEIKNRGKVAVSFIPKKAYIEKLRKIKEHEWDYKFEVKNSIGMLKFRTFNLYGQDIQNLEDDLKRAASMNLKYFIIDVRDCTGGNLNTALKVLSYFTSKEIILKRDYILRISKYCGGSEGGGKLQKRTKTYHIKPKTPKISSKLIILVDRTTSNEALDFAYIVKKAGLGKIYGEVPDQKLDHTFMVSGKSLPAVKMFAAVSCAKWDEKGKLKIDKMIELENKDYIKYISGKDDILFNKVIDDFKSF